MARPRKDAAGPKTEERIIEAFWTLLEEHQYSEITVSMIVAEAKCNRGSFYYHFVDMSDLVDAAIEEDLVTEGNLPGRLFLLATGASHIPNLFSKQSVPVRHIALLMKRGGYEKISIRMQEYIEHMWTRVFCGEGEELSSDSRFIITYSVGALLAIIARYGNGINDSSPLEGLFLGEVGGVVVRNLCSAQNMSFEEALDRLRNLQYVSKMRTRRRVLS